MSFTTGYYLFKTVVHRSRMCSMCINAAHCLRQGWKYSQYFCSVSNEMVLSPQNKETRINTNCLAINRGRMMFTNEWISGLNRLSNDSKQVTVFKAVENLTAVFNEEEVFEAELSAEYIVAHCIGQKTLSTVPRQKTILCATQLETILRLAEKRLDHQPLQYVLGEWDFRDVTLVCRHPVFIPRPETEELVDHALSDPAIRTADIFLEVGCGTGALSITLLRELPQTRCVALDKSIAACRLTEENGARLGVADRLHVMHGDVTQDGILDGLLELGPFSFIISNPPYIPHSDMDRVQPELRYEDRDALCGGQDGLNVITEILAGASRLLRPSGSIWMEVDSNHPQHIEDLVSKTDAWNLQYRATLCDFASKPRFCHIVCKSDETGSC